MSCRSAWAQVAGGGYHTVGLRPDGTLWAWGANDFGELGHGEAAFRLTPEPIP